MKPGDIVTIKNNAGLLRVRIEKELSLEDVTKCIGDDKIPDLVRPRLEYHQSMGYSGALVTLCGNLVTAPFNMYLMYIPASMKSRHAIWEYATIPKKIFSRQCIEVK